MNHRRRYGYLGTYDPRSVSQGGDVIYQAQGAAPLFEAAGRQGIEQAKRDLYPLFAFVALLALSSSGRRRVRR